MATLIRSDEEYQNMISAKQTFVLDCSATWCGPCRRIFPYFESLSSTYPIQFCSIDVDVCETVAADLNIIKLPTFVYIEDGEEKNRVSTSNKDELNNFLKICCGSFKEEKENEVS